MRVLLTRARDDAARTAARLAARGHEALVAPVIAIAATNEPPPRGPFDAALLTSARAVPALEGHAPKTLPVFAVGPRSAGALREAGFLAVRQGPGEALSLADLLRREAPGRRLLHVTGRHRKAEPEASLRQAGFAVSVWETYEARPVPALAPEAREALEGGRIGAVLHFSRRSAVLFLDRVEAAGLLAALSGPAHLCLSADVAEPLRARGLEPLVAEHPREEALVGLLDALG